MEEELTREGLTPKNGKKIYFDDYFENKTFKEKLVTFFSVKKTQLQHAWWDFSAGVSSMRRWRKTVWQDRTWGNTNIMSVLIFKLKMDRDAFAKRNITEGTDDNVANMTKVIELLERYNSYDYFEEYRKKLEEKWGEDKYYFIELQNGHFEWKSERDDQLSEADKEIETAEWNEYRRLSEAARAKDLADAFQIMQTELDSWWD